MAMTSILKTNPFFLSSSPKPRVNFSANLRFANVKFHISKPQVRKENTFEQTAVIPEEKDACRTTVIKLQVGLHVHGPSFEESINRIADNADTSNSSGLIYILNETTETLLNHFMSWIAVNSSVKVSESIEDAENYFKRISIEEREKFDRETLVNMNIIKELESISRSSDVQAVNVLWSPQDGNKPSSSGGSPLLYPPRQLLASSVLGRVGDHRANRSFSSLEDYLFKLIDSGPFRSSIHAQSIKEWDSVVGSHCLVQVMPSLEVPDRVPTLPVRVHR
ncbi:hypothetical protein ACOSP7_000945 [Xanthoceras sorbifolium]